MINTLLQILKAIMQWATPQAKLYRLRRKLERVANELRKAYYSGNEDKFNRLYDTLERLHKEISELERLK